VSIGPDALRQANLRLSLIEKRDPGLMCARCYRATTMGALLERSPCPHCGGRLFVCPVGKGRVRRVCLAE